MGTTSSCPLPQILPNINSTYHFGQWGLIVFEGIIYVLSDNIILGIVMGSSDGELYFCDAEGICARMGGYDKHLFLNHEIEPIFAKFIRLFPFWNIFGQYSTNLVTDTASLRVGCTYQLGKIRFTLTHDDMIFSNEHGEVIRFPFQGQPTISGTSFREYIRDLYYRNTHSLDSVDKYEPMCGDGGGFAPY